MRRNFWRPAPPVVDPKDAENWRAEARSLRGLDLLRHMSGYAAGVAPKPRKVAKIRLLRPRPAAQPIPRAPSKWRELRQASPTLSKRQAKLVAYPGRRFR